LKILKGDVIINRNNNLVSISELAQLQTVDSTLQISANRKLLSLDGLQNINSVNRLSIASNDELTNLQGLNGLTSISKAIQIASNTKLISLEGLENLTEVSSISSIAIFSNPLLNNLTNLEKIETTDYLIMFDNPRLESLIGLKNLNSVTGKGPGIIIANNESLTSLEGLEKLNQIGEETEVLIQSNISLSNLCVVQNIITQENNTLFDIGGNLFNPTIAEILDGNCSQ